MEQLEKDLGVSLIRVEPIHGPTLIAEGFPTRHPVEVEPTRPEVISLTATHVQILQTALQNGMESVAIFEDDAKVVAPITESLAGIPADWDILFLGISQMVQGERFQNYRKILRSYGTHALLVRGSCIPKILESYVQSQKNGYAIPADWLYSGATKVHKLKAYAPLENCVGWVTGIPNTLKPGTIRYD